MNLDVQHQLKMACRLTGATWAALADAERGRWSLDAVHHLSGPAQRRLLQHLHERTTADWPENLLRPRAAPRPIRLANRLKLSTGRLFVYPLKHRGKLLLVGADSESSDDKQLWRLMADLIDSRPVGGAHDASLPQLQTDLFYDMPRALEQVLGYFVRAAKPHGAWLGIRRGDTMHIEAQWNDPGLAGLSLSFETSRLLRAVDRSLSDVGARSDSREWKSLPHALRRSSTCWVCFPLVFGTRLIGAVALWSATEFTTHEMRRLRQLASHFSQPVEVVVTLNEVTSQLRRLAMLNDFALTISAAHSLDQIARRVLGHLARSFPAESTALYVPAPGGSVVREFRSVQGRFSAGMSPLSGHHVLPFMKGRIIRLTKASSDFRPVYHGARCGLIVPLKFRNQVVGLLSLESTHPAAFSQSDEHLMVVVASHLAGLIEYGRVREGAERRARNIGLIHEVVQQVIGLTDAHAVAHITAQLLSRYFAYELAAVVLVSDQTAGPILGFGGSKSEAVRGTMGRGDPILREGITGHVFRTGESIFVEDTSREKDYAPTLGWFAAAEMCVPLKANGQMVGIIDVQSSEPHSFTNNDLLAMELLAGVLSVVVSNADQYGRLETTILELQAAQVEGRARMAAQQQAESRLVQAAKLAAVGEMAAGIAHELNNPLTTVAGFAELILNDTPKDAPVRADVEMVLQEALRARGVVRRLLDFARQGEQIRVRTDLGEILEAVLALMTHFIQTSGVQLEAVLAKDLPWISVDSNQMKQVFLNLLHNALDAMPAGGKLRITTATRLRNDRKWVVAEIADNGIGIDPQDIDRIFEPFFTTRGSRGGTGLGLSVSYGIVADHGGTIDVESLPGAGSVFSVWLPI